MILLLNCFFHFIVLILIFIKFLLILLNKILLFYVEIKSFNFFKQLSNILFKASDFISILKSFNIFIISLYDLF